MSDPFLRSSVPSEPARHASVRDALDRTMRLMRDDLHPDVQDETLLAALIESRARLVADTATLASPAAQTAFITTALLLLRTGTTVVLDAPNVVLHGPQPPLTGDRLVTALLEAGADLIEGVACLSAADDTDDAARAQASDVVICFGDTPWDGVGALIIRLMGDAVGARVTAGAAPATGLSELPGARWDPTLRVPFGALVAAGLAAGEVYKRVMRTLAPWALSPNIFQTLFGVSPDTTVTLDLEGEVSPAELDALSDVGALDAVSGGAIVQSFLYTLARLPNVRGRVRVIEPEAADASNLNRYALLRRSALLVPKADALAAMQLGGLAIAPVVMRYDRSTPMLLGGMASAIVAGVDHIPTRWAAQKAWPQWLGIGATSHYSAMSSDHVRGTPCAWCLHPADAPDIGPIPTVAFVSHWAGLLLAWRFVRHRLGLPITLAAQYDYLTPLRADQPGALWRSPIAPRPDCRNRCTPHRHVA